MTAAAWIEWKGGKCPVPSYTSVEIRLRNGRVLGPKQAGRVDWKHRIGEAPMIGHLDTVAYREVTP